MLSTFGKVVVAAIYSLWAFWAFSARAGVVTPHDCDKKDLGTIANDASKAVFRKLAKSILIPALLLAATSAEAAGYIRFECASGGQSNGGFRATVSGSTLVHVTPGEADHRLSGHLNVNLFQGRKKIAALKNVSVEGFLERSAGTSLTLRAQNLTLLAEIAAPSWLILADETVFGTDQAQTLPLTCRRDQ